MHVAEQPEGWAILQAAGMQLLVELHDVPGHRRGGPLRIQGALSHGAPRVARLVQLNL